jgi:hypothetical protein
MGMEKAAAWRMFNGTLFQAFWQLVFFLRWQSGSGDSAFGKGRF